jgi:hypothetical protein
MNCPFPGCALDLEHDGDHVPAWRLAQRFGHAAEWGIRCEIGGCSETAVALYATWDNRGIQVCAVHEIALPKRTGLNGGTNFFAVAGAA